jgi:hypothetical protein
MSTSVANSQAITLRGSVDIVSEFFGYAINSILYQRGVYPPEKFERTQVCATPARHGILAALTLSSTHHTSNIHFISSRNTVFR